MHYAPAITVVRLHEGFLAQGSCSDTVELLWGLPLWSHIWPYKLDEKPEYHYSESALHIGVFGSFFLSG